MVAPDPTTDRAAHLERIAVRHEQRLEDMGLAGAIRTRVVTEDLGDVHVDWDRNVATTTVELARPGKEGPATRAARKRFRELARLPEWRRRIMSVFGAPLTAEDRERAYRRILGDSVRVLGDPRHGDLW
jgi:hypothetical protein